jgi:hypothetical protein
MKHAGKEYKHPRKIRRIVTSVDTCTKPRLIEIMRMQYPELNKRQAALAYDQVTSAINGWIRAYTKELPKGLHARLLLTNCFSLNLCWHRGKPGVYPDYPMLWLQLGDRLGKPGARAQLRALRLREWKRFHEGKVQPLDTSMSTGPDPKCVSPKPREIQESGEIDTNTG